MLAIVATAEGPSWTERREVAPPAPAPNEALVAVRAFAVNRGELTLVRRRDGWQPGQDVAGEVVQQAADGSGPDVGERVAGLAEWHGWAEQAAVPSHRLAVLPEAVGFVPAAPLPMAGTTAANLVRGGGPLLGSRVLITGAAGGAGHIPAPLARGGGAGGPGGPGSAERTSPGSGARARRPKARSTSSWSPPAARRSTPRSRASPPAAPCWSS